MPKATVHEDAGPVFPQHDVGMPRQPWTVQSVTETMRPQILAHNHLWLRTLTADSSHILVALVRYLPSHNYLFMNHLQFIATYFRQILKVWRIAFSGHVIPQESSLQKSSPFRNDLLTYASSIVRNLDTSPYHIPQPYPIDESLPMLGWYKITKYFL